jgi:DNA-binding response OmpR family regulator
MTDRLTQLAAENALLRARLAAFEAPALLTIIVVDLTMQPDAWRFLWQDKPVTLTRGEGEIIQALVRRPGVILNRDQLIAVMHGWNGDIFDRTVDSMIKRLRRKFREVDCGFDRIETMYGLGYRWRAE